MTETITTGMFITLLIAISLSALMSTALLIIKYISRRSKTTAATYMQNSAAIVKDGSIPKDAEKDTSVQIDMDSIATKLTPLIEGLQTIIELIKTGVNVK